MTESEHRKTDLKDFELEISRCIHCKACTISDAANPNGGFPTGCPAWNAMEWEAYSGGAKLWLARAMIKGDYKIDKDALDILYRCSTCGNCEAQCENELPTIDIIEAMRAEAVRAGIGPLDKQIGYSKATEVKRNPYNEPHENRTAWVPKEFKRKDKADVIFFVGCTSSYRLQELAKSTLHVMQKLGADVGVKEDEYCCCSPLIRVGKLDLVPEYVKHNVELFKASGAKVVVSSCAGCFRTMMRDWPKYYGPLPFEVKHSTNFVAELLKAGKAKLKPLKGIVATYHDPCHYGRHVGQLITNKKERAAWYEVPRTVLRTLLGDNFVEMRRVKENSWCCGAGGGARAQFPDWTLNTSIERIKEAEETGATHLVSTCPFCETSLQLAIEKTGSKLKLVDLIQLVEKALE
ncbi:MAG: (Fe-S)-binding protein [Promethearchaeota archaeon]